MLILTLKHGLPRVLRFMVGVMPIMFGYAFFGMLYFGGSTTRFGTLGSSLVTLFAVLNGDVIRETFLDLMYVDATVSQIFMYTFISLFIYVVLNVFIAIIEEAFFWNWKNRHVESGQSLDTVYTESEANRSRQNSRSMSSFANIHM